MTKIAYRLERLPKRKRRKDLWGRFEQFSHEGFHERVLEFGAKPALAYCQLCNTHLEQGLYLDAFDMMIAAIVQVNDCAISTRNTDDFQDCSLQLVNPYRE